MFPPAPPAATTPATPSRLPRDLLLLALVGLGVFLRTLQFGVNRSMWMDEAMLALNLVQRGYGALLGPLDYGQAAPVGFLLTERLLFESLGRGEWVLRLFPLLCGVGSLLLMAGLVRRWLAGWGAPLALGLFAISDRLVYYSSEVKQYSTDVLVTTAILYLGTRCLDAPDPRQARRWLLLLGLAGLLVMPFSHPSVFVLAAVMGGLLLREGRAGRWRAMLPGVAWAMGWLVVFGALYLLTMRRLHGQQDLESYWAEGFAPSPFWSNPAWYPVTLARLLHNPSGWEDRVVLPLLVLAWGGWAVARRSGERALMLLGPILITLATAALHLYPARGRLMLFTLPLVYLLVGCGAEAFAGLVARHAGRRAGLVAAALLAVALCWEPATLAARNVRKPPLLQHTRPLFAYVKRQAAPGDLIYLFHRADKAALYYASETGLAPGDYIQGQSFGTDWPRYAEEARRLPQRRRTWFIVSHVTQRNAKSREVILAELRRGVIHERHERAGTAELYVFDYAQP